MNIPVMKVPCKGRCQQGLSSSIPVPLHSNRLAPTASYQQFIASKYTHLNQRGQATLVSAWAQGTRAGLMQALQGPASPGI